MSTLRYILRRLLAALPIFFGITAAVYLLSAFSSGIYIGRIPVLTTLQGYIILPWLIDRMFTRTSAWLVRIVFISVYLIFFYYQMHIAWQLI